MSNLSIAVAIYLAYLMGSVSSAVIVCKIMGLPDPRTQGSHNPGASNVLRIGGAKAAIFTLLGDMLKGLIPVLIAAWYGFDETALALIAFGAVLGHLYPIFFRFEGGKGIATAIGCLLVLSWPAGLCWIATWLFIAITLRYASFASLLASALAPLYIWYFTENSMVCLIIACMSILLICRHHSNIHNLLRGEEHKIGQKN